MSGTDGHAESRQRRRAMRPAHDELWVGADEFKTAADGAV